MAARISVWFTLKENDIMILWKPHRTIKDCLQAIHNCLDYRISPKGWCVLGLPRMKILAHGKASCLEQAARQIEQFYY